MLRSAAKAGMRMRQPTTKRLGAQPHIRRQSTHPTPPTFNGSEQEALRNFTRTGTIGPYLIDVFRDKAHRLPQEPLYHGGAFPKDLTEYIKTQHKTGQDAVIKCGPVLSFSKKKEVAAGFMQKHPIGIHQDAVLLNVTPDDEVKGLDISDVSFAGESEVVFGASEPQYMVFPYIQNQEKILSGTMTKTLTEEQESVLYQGEAYQPPLIP